MHFTLADLVTDISQNGAESGASIVELHISEISPSAGKGEFRFTVKDNGKGMSGEELKRAQDPFVTDGIKHVHRKVGLGIPFLIQTAETSGGGWKIESRKKTGGGKAGDGAAAVPSGAPAVPPGAPAVPQGGAGEPSGTEVSAWFDLGNIDTPPVGDVPGLIRTVLLFHGPEEIVVKRILERAGKSAGYELRKTELVDALGNLEEAGSLILLDRYLRSLEGDEGEESEEHVVN